MSNDRVESSVTVPHNEKSGSSATTPDENRNATNRNIKAESLTSILKRVSSYRNEHQNSTEDNTAEPYKVIPSKLRKHHHHHKSSSKVPGSDEMKSTDVASIYESKSQLGLLKQHASADKLNWCRPSSHASNSTLCDFKDLSLSNQSDAVHLHSHSIDIPQSESRPCNILEDVVQKLEFIRQSQENVVVELRAEIASLQMTNFNLRYDNDDLRRKNSNLMRVVHDMTHEDNVSSIKPTGSFQLDYLTDLRTSMNPSALDNASSKYSHHHRQEHKERKKKRSIFSCFRF